MDIFFYSGDVNKTDEKGSTALHVAAAYGNQSALELLMTNGANLFSLDDYGRTAARVAAFYQKADCCRYLDTLAIRWQVQSADAVSKLQIKAMRELKKRSKKTEESRDTKTKKLSYDYATAPNDQKPRPTSSVSENFGGRKKISTEEAMMQNFELRPPTQPSSNNDQINSSSAGSTLRNLPGRQAGPLINNLAQLPLKIEPADDARHSILLPYHSSSEPQLIQKKSGSGLPQLELTGGHPTVTKNESALATFLHSLDLIDCVQILHGERLDLDALSMCTEEDLASIGLSLGPRKKLLHGIARRKAMLAGSGKLEDTEF